MTPSLQDRDRPVAGRREREQQEGERSLLPAGLENVLIAVFALTAVLFAAVVLRVPDRTFADDSYFYFQVAWNMARGMGSTFNTIMPTNGYHPLWMLICTGVFKLIPSRQAGVHGIAAVIVVLDLLMLFTVARLLRRTAAHLWPIAFALLLPFCFASQLGTEGALSGLFLALLMVTAFDFVVAPDGRRAVLFQLVAAIAVLSRLDNIFIVGFVSAAVFLAPSGGTLASVAERRALQLRALPIPLVLWAIYLGSNWIFFETLQPISGMLKSHSAADHALGGNLPHSALVALAVIVPSFAVVAFWRRDLFFRSVELPFALGVLCHLLYIVFVMSSETRWTWYYTSWMLLGGVLLARAASVVFDGRSQLATAVCVLAAVVAAGAWYKVSYLKFLRGPDTRPPAAFNAEVYGRLGVRRAIAFDEPGVYAFFSDIEIVPIDGLMGDLAFQHELATKGIQEFVDRAKIDAFIGPDSPMDEAGANQVCRRVFLSSEQFRCERQADGRYRVVGVDIYARVPSKPAGTLVLDPDKVIWRLPHAIEVWRLQH